jgi:hypothetical protein
LRFSGAIVLRPVADRSGCWRIGIGIDHAILSRWERGRGTIRLSTVDQIVRWLENEEARIDAFIVRQHRTQTERSSVD